MMDLEEKTIHWLMEGDPAIRWQVIRYLLNKDETSIQNERAKVAEMGWGARLLEKQDKNGSWANKPYSPKWISTTYTMLVLRRLGLPVDQPQALQACRFLIDKGYYKDGGINFWPSRKLSETCVTGMVLSILAYFQFTDDRLHNIPHHLIGQQMEDGGWNCESNKGANHSSFHTTINVLEGLWLYEKRYFSGSDRIRTSRQKAHQFLLTHRLFQSHRTGKVVDKRMTRFSFPPRWRYDLFRALDYFQECNALYDNRMGDAVAICRKRRRKDGTWPLQQRHPGKTWFEMEHTGQPSRWNTLRALRILNWVEGRQ